MFMIYTFKTWILFLIMYVCAIMWVANVVQVSVENRGDRCCWTWNYRWLQAASLSHVGAENWTPGFFERTARALNHWTISVAQNIFWVVAGPEAPDQHLSSDYGPWTVGLEAPENVGMISVLTSWAREKPRYSSPCFLLILLPSHGWVFAPPVS